jgi:hypothetical protein
VERDEHNERLDARSAARLVDSELSEIRAALSTLRAGKLGVTGLAAELKKLPTTAWTASQQRLARTVRAEAWNSVSDAYASIRFLLPDLLDAAGGVPRGSPRDEALRLRGFKKGEMGAALSGVGYAQRDLKPYTE